MASVSMLPSGRFRGFARVGEMRETASFDRRADALSWATKTEARMRKGTWSKAVEVPAQREPSRTVLQAFEAYRESDEWLEKGDVTRRAERSKQRAVERLLGMKALDELTKDDVRGFIGQRRTEAPSRTKDPKATMSNDAVRLEVCSLSAMLNWAENAKLVPENVAKHVKKPKGNRRQTRLDDDIIGKVINFMIDLEAEGDGRPYVFFKILLGSVCRPGELAVARRSWLRVDPPQIVLPTTKNNDPRVIVLTQSNYKLLSSHLQSQDSDCPYLFGTRRRDRKGWSPYNYRVPFDKARKKLGLTPDIVAYLSRHEGISRLFERTMLSDGQISGITGHRSPQALWHYKHLRVEHQRGVITALDEVMTGAVDRVISSSHPSQPLKPGEMLSSKESRSPKGSYGSGRNAD